jgi:hypothetical protein
VEEYPAPGGFAAEETILVESGVVLKGYEGHGGGRVSLVSLTRCPCPSAASARPFMRSLPIRSIFDGATGLDLLNSG